MLVGKSLITIGTAIAQINVGKKINGNHLIVRPAQIQKKNHHAAKFAAKSNPAPTEYRVVLFICLTV